MGFISEDTRAGWSFEVSCFQNTKELEGFLNHPCFPETTISDKIQHCQIGFLEGQSRKNGDTRGNLKKIKSENFSELKTYVFRIMKYTVSPMWINRSHT